MANYNFGYYYFKRMVSTKHDGNATAGYYYIGLRLDTVHMEVESVRNALGFLKANEIVNADRGVTVDVEKTFHCAASKGLVGHLAFMLEPEDTSNTDAKWGSLFDTSLTFVKKQNVDDIRTFLYGHGWSPPGGGQLYKTVVGSIKERRRRGQ